MLLHAWTILYEPAINFAGAPGPVALAVDDDGVERLLEQERLHFFGIHRGDHFGSGSGQHVALELEHGFFILNQQDPSRESDFATRARQGLLGRCALACGRQHDFDDAAAVCPVLRPDLSAMLLNNAVTDAETKARTLAHAFGGVEGIKNAMRFLDAGTGIVK